MELLEYVKNSWSGWVCSAFAPIIAYLYSQVMASRNGVRALLRVEVIRVYNKYHDDLHYCPIYVKWSIEDVYKQYRTLHGNGVGTRLYEEIMAFPTEPEREEQGMKGKIAKLIDVKSIMTLALIGGFTGLTRAGEITGEQFLTIFTMVVGFYLGTQSEENKQKQKGVVRHLPAARVMAV